MLVLKRVRTLKRLTRPIELSNRFSEKRDFSFWNSHAFKNCTHGVEKYNECIKNGISSNSVITNEWILNLKTSKYPDN